jgi:hypothetical protein
MRSLKLAIPVLAIAVSALVVIAQSDSSDSPMVISAVAPIYPPIARQARAASNTIVEVEIDREGKVKSVESKGRHPLLSKGGRRSCSAVGLFSCEHRQEAKGHPYALVSDSAAQAAHVRSHIGLLSALQD